MLNEIPILVSIFSPNRLGVLHTRHKQIFLGFYFLIPKINKRKIFLLKLQSCSFPVVYNIFRVGHKFMSTFNIRLRTSDLQHIQHYNFFILLYNKCTGQELVFFIINSLHHVGHLTCTLSETFGYRCVLKYISIERFMLDSLSVLYNQAVHQLFILR